jgi:uncharacterized protein involved in exopolysaccharide biosynthesis
MTPRVQRTLGVSLFLAGLISIGLGIRLWYPPARFTAKTRVKIDRDFERDAANTNSYNAYFIQNEFELIQSDVILGNVIESLGLQNRWRKKEGRNLGIPEALAILKTHLSLEPVRCTSLVGIHLTSEDPKEAAEITQAIADEYERYRRSHKESGVSAEVIDPAAIALKPISHRGWALSWLGLGALLAISGTCCCVRRKTQP